MTHQWTYFKTDIKATPAAVAPVGHHGWDLGGFEPPTVGAMDPA